MKKVLVVEDEQMLAKIIGMKLQEEGFEVEHVIDGEDAYKHLTQAEGLPDLVLLDVLLPKMSGFDVLERLKAEQRPIPKVIVFSNFAQKADVERAYSLGALDYIVKGAFTPAEILGKIKSVLTAEVFVSDAASMEPVRRLDASGQLTDEATVIERQFAVPTEPAAATPPAPASTPPVMPPATPPAAPPVAPPPVIPPATDGSSDPQP